MKTKIFSTLAIVFSMACLSFTMNPGGEGFQIFINNKLVLQQFGKDMNEVKTISIDPAVKEASLSVKYYHCGKPGSKRSLTIKNSNNKILKQWSFSDESKTSTPMKCSMNEIFSLKNVTEDKLYLYYSAAQLSQERLLVTIDHGKNRTAKK